MSAAGAAIVAAARSCIGARFRPHGRDRAIGLDCVGVAAIAFAAAGARVRLPQGYALRGGGRDDIARWMLASGLAAVEPGEAGAGDLLLVEAGPRQLHLLVLTGAGFVHADARMRRVVEAPGAPRWPAVAAWRWPDGR